MKIQAEKYFKLSFQDRNDNELKSFVIRAYYLADAKKSAKLHFANCMINDCTKIIVIPQNY